MKLTPVIILIIAFGSTAGALGQARASINLDLRADAPTTTGSTRVRRLTGDRPANLSTGQLERHVFDLLNAERRKNGLSELTWSDDVASVARLHSENMAHENFFSHRGTDGSMVDDRADRMGLGAWKTIGENIAYMKGYEDPAAVAVQKWLESTAHRKNLLGPNWRESAVGVSVAEDGSYYMTQVFLLRK
jgi:uncharacterized protein YkwD